jgi:hypothetical protein
MAVKKKRKAIVFKTQGQERTKGTIKARNQAKLKERNHATIHEPHALDYPIGQFTHPAPNSADFDIIYLRGKK